MRLDGFQDRTVAVVGLGLSGRATVRALAAGGARLQVWDDGAAAREAAAKAGLPVVAPEDMAWGRAAALVLSPGVPLTHPKPHPAVRAARAAGVEVIGDVELFLRAGPGGRLAAISGTNGKSTTTALLGHVLARAGRAVQVGGNLGTPALDLDRFPAGAEGITVLELSSYQIDLTPSLRPDVAVLLNISPDHLDRHGGLAGYVAVKRRLCAGQTAGQVAVVSVDDDHCRRIAADLAAAGHRVVPVSVGEARAEGVSVVDGRLFEGAEEIADLGAARALPGAHNWQNAAAAYGAARALGLAPAEIVAGLADFPGLAHRQEQIADIGGIRFVNDSKATNAQATARALACYDAIYWIAGGRPKEGGLASLAPSFGRIRHAFLIGEAANQFAAELDGRVCYTIAGDLTTAVRAAWRRAAKDPRGGGVILLSPAAASFDQFANFEARGEAFRAAVGRLGRGPA